MAKRKKELFELLNRDRDGSPAPTREPEPSEPIRESAPPRSRPEAAPVSRSTETPPEESTPRRRGFGGHRVAVSLNVLLLFVGAFVVTNVCSYIVGKGISGRTEVPLTTEMRLFYAAKVTPPVAARHNFAVWALRDRLRDAGFERTEVLGLENGEYLQIVAGRFDRERRADCERLVERVRDHFARHGSKRQGDDEFVVPIDVRTITISYTPYKPDKP